MKPVKNEFKDFYDTLYNNLESYNGEYASFIDYGPELFLLLNNLLYEENLTKEDRMEISSAIAYYVVPKDVISEAVYGPYGYIDDIYCASYVLRKIENKFSKKALEKYWHEDEDIDDVLDDCLEKTSTLLEEEQIDEIFVYVGLK